jgi:BirA family biotin operon repressor/biotin-[acetyl-CoA-carboxylase] ligase
MLQPKVSRHFHRVDSTNSALLRDLSGPQPPPPGTVYTAAFQTAGRGQGRAVWHGSAGDNLALSIYLAPDRLAVDRIFSLTAFTALAVRATIASCVRAPTAVRIKWPNDVYVNDRKIAGILIQNALRGSRVQSSVIGVGLNVNESCFPPELQTTATSLRELTDTVLEVNEVLGRLLDAFVRHYPLLAADRYFDLLAAYHEHLYRYRETGRYRQVREETEFEARLDGVAPDGRLLLTLPDGSKQRFANKEVVFLP